MAQRTQVEVFIAEDKDELMTLVNTFLKKYSADNIVSVDLKLDGKVEKTSGNEKHKNVLLASIVYIMVE